MDSPKFRLNKKDILYIVERAKIFLFPLLVLYLPCVALNIEKDGFQFQDFSINEFQTGALVLYVLNRITTAVQLFLKNNK